MAVQIESQGQLQEFLGILKRRKWQVLLPASIVLSLAVAAAVIVPKKYVARTQIELRPVGVSISTKEGSSAVFQLRAIERIQRILKERQNAEFLALSVTEQMEFVTRVQSDIRVTPAPGATGTSSFVNIEYMDISREWAQDFLSALSKDWIDDVLTRDRHKAADEYEKLDGERKKLQLQLQDLEQKLSDLKGRHNLSATQPPPGSGSARNEDPVYKRMTDAEDQLRIAKLQLDKNNAKLDLLQRQINQMPAMVKQESTTAGASNDAELAEIDKQIKDLREKNRNLKPAASGWTTFKRDLDVLQKQRDETAARKTRSTTEVAFVENPEIAPRRIELAALQLTAAESRTAVKHLEEDVKELQAELDERSDVYLRLNELEGSASRVRASLEDTEKRFNEKQQQSVLLSSPQANPFSITEPVHVGSKPTEPNPWLIISFGLVLGLALGLGIALVAEFSRNCFRSVADISRVMVVPVLGSIGTILTRRQRRITLARRTIVGASSLAFVAAILFVTWAWASHAQFLSQDLRDAIEQLRSKLR
jgi:uncharacterized protein involved in exopolysaccharide biosynthesis